MPAPHLCLVSLLMIASCATSRPARAAELTLTADWNGAASTVPFPVTAGVPFARGALKDGRSVLLTAGSRQLPLQTEVLARWPDKSVKWLLLDFQARPGRKNFVLKYGDGVQGRAAAGGIKAGRKDGTVTVDTGALRFTVEADGCGFIDRLSYAGRKVFGSAGKRLNLMDFIHTADPADYHPMDRYIKDGQLDASSLAVTEVKLETAGPLHAVVLIAGKYKYKLVGSTITGTDVKGDCPFRLRIHAYAGKSYLKVEHFFYYEGDGDHDFTRSLALKVPLPAGEASVRYIGPGKTIPVDAPMSGLYQQSADAFEVWRSDGKAASVVATGGRFEGVLDVVYSRLGVAVGIKEPWQNAAKSLHADLKGRQLGIYFWPPEAPPLDYRRHAREWSVGESYAPYDPKGQEPRRFDLRSFPQYRLASKGVGKTHYALVYFHDPAVKPKEILTVYRLINRRPLLWAPAEHYAESLALGRYRQRVPGEHEEVEWALDLQTKYWRFSQERFRWYGFWIYGQVCQEYNNYQQHGRWTRDFGRWGWACGDSVGRLAYALMLQAVRKCDRKDFELGEQYLYNVHDVCSTHTPAYPHHYKNKFIYVKGASHRHGAWPWAGPYLGARGSHPVGAKIFYFLTGEGHAKDILDEMTQLAVKNPHGGEGDGPLGINIQSFLYQWETTGKDEWLDRAKAEIEGSKALKTASTGWDAMIAAAFGIYNGLEEYMDLTGDYSYANVASDFADRSMPRRMRRSWTWPEGYYRVYACAYNLTGEPKYAKAIRDSLGIFVSKSRSAIAGKTPPKDWPGPAGGPRAYLDGNVIRDIPFALYALHNKQAGKEGR